MSEAATQSASNVLLKVGSGTSLNFGANDISPSANNTFSLGANNFFSQVLATEFVPNTSGQIRFFGRSKILSPVDGLIRFTDSVGNSGSATVQYDSRAYSISADTNNFDGIVPGYFQKWTASGAIRSLTGITFSSSTKSDGQVHFLVNVSSNNLVIKNENASSTAANRFTAFGGNDITIPQDSGAGMIYDGSTQRWRIWPLYNFYSAGTPSIAGNGTLNTGSKDSAGKITATGTGASTIVLTFSITFARAPACMITNETTSNLVRPVSTTTTLTVSATIVNGDSLAYICTGY